MLENCITSSNKGSYVSIEVHPNSKKNEIKYNEWRNVIEVKVKSPAISGKANKEVVKLFSQIFGTEVLIVKGAKSRFKVIFTSLSKGEVVERLSKVISH